MKIKHRYTGDTIREVDGDSLRGANLRGANLYGADLRDAYLQGAYLRDAYLQGAYLQGADLRGANLQRADLYRADLRDAYLRDAYLQGAYLQRANLYRANLYRANLQRADLRGADLQGAYLRDADLQRAYLRGANLSNTILDPMTQPNGDADAFGRDGDWCIGYRTKTSPHLGGPGYSVGEVCEAPVFSVSGAECHPGIFVLPTVAAAAKWLDRPGDPIVKVIFRPWDCHRAGAKWRVRWLIVWEEVER